MTKPPEIYDPIRKKNIQSTPEESVRQNIIQYLLQICKVPPHMIEVEFSLNKWAGPYWPTGARADILVWIKNKQGELVPWLLVECKAPHVKIEHQIELQVSRYLKSVQPIYMLFTNGPESSYYKYEEYGYVEVEGLPQYSL